MEKIKVWNNTIPVYTSDELKEKLKDFIDKRGYPKSKKILIQLIDDGIIIPIINEQSILRKLIMLIRRQHNNLDYLYGFQENGKCYVIFSKYHTTKELVETTLHESIHISHRQFPEIFSKLNMPIYLDFYSYFYKELFKADKYKEKDFNLFVEKLTTNWFYGDLLYNSFKDYTKLSDYQIKEVFEKIHFIFEMSNFNADKVPFQITMLLNATYRKLFTGIDHYSGVFQEIYNPAEIICVLSTINPEHPNVIKSLKMISPMKKPVIHKLTKKYISKMF